MENGHHRLFTFQLSKLDPHLVNEKLGQVFEKLDYTAKIPGDVLGNNKTGENCCFNAFANNTLFDKPILFHKKVELTTKQNQENKQDVRELCTRE